MDSRKRIAGELVEAARDIMGASDLMRRLADRKDELRNVVSEVDQILTFMDVSDNQRKALTAVANHAEKALVQVNRAMRG